ncbi:hypothetical protein BDF21DRAFT_394642 [Thamnidium elegans]|nr:hypothetical protein BDF21DRAFT_394642 [Thamnidium elegans]
MSMRRRAVFVHAIITRVCPSIINEKPVEYVLTRSTNTTDTPVPTPSAITADTPAPTKTKRNSMMVLLGYLYNSYMRPGVDNGGTSKRAMDAVLTITSISSGTEQSLIANVFIYCPL